MASGPGRGRPGDAAPRRRPRRDLFDIYRETVEDLRGDDVLDGETPSDPVDLSYTLAAALVLNLAERQSLLECPTSSAGCARAALLRPSSVRSRDLVAAGDIDGTNQVVPELNGCYWLTDTRRSHWV